ncbi:MAG: hypothetical protein E7Z98_03275 [Olsenella sp.]|nr:hypothetical protein [Olsenella sp.]
MSHSQSRSKHLQSAFTVSLCGILAFSAIPRDIQAAPSSQELAQEREGLEAQLAEAQEQLDELEGEIEAIQQELEESEATLDATRDEVDKTRVQIDEANQQLAEKREALGNHIRDSYKIGPASMMNILLGATSYEDLVSRIYYLDRVNEARADEIRDVNELAAQLVARERELEEAEARQQAAIDDVEAKAAEYEDMVAQAQAYYDGLDEDIARVMAEEEAARAAEEEAARKAAEEAAATEGAAGITDPASTPAASTSLPSDAGWDFGSVSSSEVSPGEYEQSTPALLSFATGSYSTVSNQYYGFQSSKNYQHMGNYNSYKQRLSYESGDMSLEFETLVQLPVTYNYSADLGNPQAMCLSPDGSTAYVAYPDGHGHSYTQQGFIVRYDLARLRERGAMDGDMSAFATGVRLGDTTWRSCMVIGPRINMGHGQCMAIDPSTGNLWMSTRGSAEYSDLTLIDTDSLTPVRQIRFHTGGTEFGSVLTFDESGNFYFVKRSGSSWGSSPAGSLRIYQGRISGGMDRVLIRLLPQSVRYPAGSTLQGVAWDTTTDTLYVVNDSALLAVGMGSLISGGSLSAGSVRTEFLSPFREYEAMAFDAGGTPYIMVNRQAEIMRLS